MKRSLLVIFVACAATAGLAGLAASGCNTSPDTGKVDMAKAVCMAFEPAAECKPADVVIKPLKGTRQSVISTLKIANYNEGFDLNCDGKPDNVLSPLAAVANTAIDESFQTKHDVVVPMEFFGYSGTDTDCAKFAFYLGRVLEDRDNDGAQTSWETGKSDCDDTNDKVRPGAKEDLTNRLDDDCDGLADNATPMSPPADKDDKDGDGQSLADGDCDDRSDTPEHTAIAKLRKKGGKDICGNGIDDDCNGVADDDATCDPFKDNNVPMHVQGLSFSNPGTPVNGVIPPDGLKPLITFPDGKVSGGVLTAGPDLFELNLQIDNDISLKLTLSGARVKLKLAEMNGGTYVKEGVLGGVLQAVSLSQIHIAAGNILKKEQSLLDGVFVGPAATLLGLNTDKEGHYLPDVDVDGDGLETFWQEGNVTAGDGGAKLAVVDTCRDGDGTIIHNNFDGKGTLCALAKDSNGKYRFVDGLSAALKFTAVPVKLQDVTPK